VDRAIWAGLGRLPQEDETPAIAVEFVSEGRRSHRRDYQIKRDEYRSAGVREYWIIDRFARLLTVHRFTRGKTATKAVRERQTYTTPLLPGFELPLASLLALMDRWSG
jgi:Uma2 family endonuclease